jgi:hypothetical protein
MTTLAIFPAVTVHIEPGLKQGKMKQGSRVNWQPRVNPIKLFWNIFIHCFSKLDRFIIA